MLDRLKPGMAKSQVRFIMGTPTVIDPFHPERWEYVYTYTESASQRQQRRLTLYFEEEKLAYLEGDVKTSLRKPPENFAGKSRIVEVPDRRVKGPGLIENIMRVIPFIGDDKPQPKPVEKSEGSEAQPPQPEAVPEEPVNDQNDADDETAGKKEEPGEKGFFGRLLDKLPGKDGGSDENVADTAE
jgi:outer membrane protein assembly factor BamE